MTIYSKRQKQLRGEVPKGYTYDLPEQLRVKIIYLWQRLDIPVQNSLGYVKAPSEMVVEFLCEEYGRLELSEPDSRRMFSARNYHEELKRFFLEETDTEKILDAVEVIFDLLPNFHGDYETPRNYEWRKSVREASETLNRRFQEHGVGYQLANGKIIRVDSEYLHKEAVEPALHLLDDDPAYSEAQKNFLKAHRYYRKEDFDAALIACGKSLESTLKTICNKRGWKHQCKAGTTSLLKTCFEGGLIPEYWKEYFPELATLLGKGVSKARNEVAHGQRKEERPIPRHIAICTLNMTASAIRFLVEAEKS